MIVTDPQYTRTETEDGWVLTADYGAYGVSRAQIHIAHGTPQDAEKNRRELDRVLGRLGYKLAAAT